MARKLPPDAFSYYAGLGPERSYQVVAEHYGVSKQAVTKLAVRESWQRRLEDIERKALETLKTMPLATAMEAVRALDMSIAKERLVRGEPSDRTAIEVEEVIRREYDRWLVTPGEGRDGDTAA